MILEIASTLARSQYVNLYTSTNPFAVFSFSGDHGHSTGQCGSLADRTTYLQSKFSTTGIMGFTHGSVFG